MSVGFQELQPQQFTDAIAEVLVPRIAQILGDRAPGHCMRVADLDNALMIKAATLLRTQVPEAQIFILGNATQEVAQSDLFISSTKLIELRNPLPDESLRSPLLVFLPAHLQTNAEDSFNVAVFEEISVIDVYQELIQSLLKQVPITLQGDIRELLAMLTKAKWDWAEVTAQVRYLLAAKINGMDGDTLGAALYELGLVPDFHLFDQPSTTQSKLFKNLEVVKQITQDQPHTLRGRILNLELLDKTLQNRLIQLLLSTGIEDLRSWTRQIVLDRSYWTLEFDKWKRKEEVNYGEIQIEVTSIDLPTAHEQSADIRVQSIVGSKFLAAKDQKKIKVEINVTPPPSQVPGLKYFTAQIMAQSGGTVGSIKKINASARIKSFTLDKLDKVNFDEGWHFIRVLAWTADGEPIPLAQPTDRTSLAPTPHESEDFYILPDGELEEDPNQRSVPEARSLEHIRLQLQFKAIAENRNPSDIAVKEILWKETRKSAAKAAQETLEVQFGRDGKFHIPVSSQLKQLELQILRSPDQLAHWKMAASPTSTGDLQPITAPYRESTALNNFLSARSQYFQSFINQNTEYLAQSIDWTTLETTCLSYAVTYQEWLKELQLRFEQGDGKALLELKQALALDSLSLTLKDYRGSIKEAILVGSTHPLRAIWSVTWAKITQTWVNATQTSSAEVLVSTRESVQSLIPLNMPAFQPLTDGRLFITVDNLNPFWTLYAPTDEADVRGLVGQVCAAIGLSEPKGMSGAAITGELLASRVERYLTQHPYIRTLSINAFNPGQASVLADALALIQKREPGKALRYDIRLFVPDPDAPTVGDALEYLLSSSVTDAGQSEQNFPAINSHLFPKFNLAIYPTQSFQSHPDRYPAHLSFLFDIFPTAAISAALPFRPKDTSPLYGLVQDFVVQFEHDDETGTRWQRQPRHGEASSIPEAKKLIECLTQLSELFSGATAAIATGTAIFNKRPVITLALDTRQQELIHQIHTTSDWVFTIDRNLGIEFFDQGEQTSRPAYLVDYVPSGTATFGHRLVITSRSLTELEAILARVLQEKKLQADSKHCAVILNQLRSLSGRLALKLISSPQQQSEVLGLALARMFLAYQGALDNQIILPIDTHLELFQTAQRQADAAGESISLQRTDLALFDLNLTTRTIQCNLVEVKCYSQVGGLSDYQRLREEIIQQVNQSEDVLRRHFEPKDRPDQLLKIRELTNLLEFYLSRALRYGLMKPEVAQEAEIFLTTLEQGYNLEFSRSALIFDFSQPGTEPADQESGIEFYRIGVDLIQELVASTKPPITAESETEENLIESPSLPRIASAVFLTPQRPYSTTWDSLTQNSDPHSSSSNAETPTPTVKPEISSGTSKPIEPSEENVPASLPETSSPSESDNELPTQQPECPCDVTLGVQAPSPQFGILGEAAGRKIALDLNQTHTISLFGVQGAGKSYTLGSFIEMACLPIPMINALPNPLATVIFHYSPTEDYKPEFTSMVHPNSDVEQLAALRDRYGAAPASLKDVVILTSAAKVTERQSEYPGIQVLPIAFASSELKVSHWKFLMGAVGSQSLYLRQINSIMKKLRDRLTLDSLLEELEQSNLAEHLKELVRSRLNFASEYIDDANPIEKIIRPGRLVIIDLRDEFIEKDEALGLFGVLLQIFSDVNHADHPFNKLIVLDEAHKYVGNSDLIAGLVEVVREMRHKRTSVLIASQDPSSVPTALIELSTQVILHKFNSPAWLKHLQKAITVLNTLTPEKLSQLGAGEAYIWSSKATDTSFTNGALKIRCRPRVTQHGGSTKTARR